MRSLTILSELVGSMEVPDKALNIALNQYAYQSIRYVSPYYFPRLYLQ